MHLRILLPAAASLCLAASAAFAQAAPAAPPPDKPGSMMHMRHFDPAEMQKHIGQMCENHYAKAVGRVAELETRLDLTTVQKPLFNRWRESILSAAKQHVADCQNFKMPDRDASIVEHARMHQKMLQARLDILKAQMPALEALNASLSPEQQKTFKHAAMRMMMEGHGQGMMGGMHRMHGGGWMMRHHRGDDTPAPPPAD